MINVKNLFKSYGKNVVFNNLNLEFEDNKITVILGESGSGKTTLLNCIANLTDYKGEITSKKCSYVFQKPNLFNNLTVKDNLKIVNDSETAVLEMAKKLQIEDKLLSYPKHLSGGQAQRVSLARGLIYNAEVVLLDEPFSNLDIALRFSLINEFKALQKESPKTVVFVTHDIKEAVSLADRIIVIKKGEKIFDVDTITEDTENQLYNVLLSK